jgi:mannobiose 2-epimerase
LSGESRFLKATLASWHFIREHLVDRQYGEWYRITGEAGRAPAGEKAGPWKTPYHNARACLEVMRRIQEVTAGEKRRSIP